MENTENIKDTQVNTDTENVQDNTTTEDQKITITQEELAELIAKKTQSEVDRRVTMAVKKVSDKYEKQLSLSKLDESAREAAEKDMRIKELEDQLKEYSILQNKAEVTKTLAGRGLSPVFADILTIGDDLEEAQQNIATLDKLFKEAVSNEVKKRLAAQASTPSGGQGDNLAAQRADFKKKSLAEQNKLYQENPELYKVLTEY